MAIKPCTSAAAAGWITSSLLPWDQLVGFGPAGFERHARLRVIPDPTHEGQSENEAQTVPGALPEEEMLQAALSVLRSHTTTPDELFFAFWDGFGFDMPAARFAVPNREFFLYRGAVSEGGSWDIAPKDQAPGQQWVPSPAFVWPSDHAWCLAFDVDPHWAGIGAGRQAVEALLADARLDAVTANPADRQPNYY